MSYGISGSLLMTLIVAGLSTYNSLKLARNGISHHSLTCTLTELDVADLTAIQPKPVTLTSGACIRALHMIPAKLMSTNCPALISMKRLC